MIAVHHFTFNAFQENTYLIYEPGFPDCWIIDPGCSNDSENKELLGFIDEQKLIPTKLINTHCHIDHVLGNQIVASTFGLTLEAHQLELPVLASCEQVAIMYGIPYLKSPSIETFLEEGNSMTFRNQEINILLTPGHSPGSICLVNRTEKWVISGDVLFYGSIGRTDLPGGDYQTLMGSIVAKLMTLSDDLTVYPGHGPSTTIGQERQNNPFISGYQS